MGIFCVDVKMKRGATRMFQEFDFNGLNDHLTKFLTMFVEMIYHLKAWFAKAANAVHEHPYNKTDAGEDECLLGDEHE